MLFLALVQGRDSKNNQNHMYFKLWPWPATPCFKGFPVHHPILVQRVIYSLVDPSIVSLCGVCGSGGRQLWKYICYFLNGLVEAN